MSFLREHPGATTQRQIVLDRVDLSRRQRQLLQEAQLKSDELPVPQVPNWEPVRYEPLGRLLSSLRNGRTPRAVNQHAVDDYTVAVTVARVGLVNRTPELLQACVRQAPEQPLAHFMLGQILRLQQRTTTAWHHTMRAWELLQTQMPRPTLLHMQVVNQMLVLLSRRELGEEFLSWIEQFKGMAAELRTRSLSPDDARRLQQEEGECALSYGLYLGGSSSVEAVSERQLALLNEAVEKGSLLTRHDALHCQADLLSRLQRPHEAEFAYAKVLEEWPDDRLARLRHALLKAARLAVEADGEEVESVLAEALALAFAAGPSHDRPSPLTMNTTLGWLRHISSRDPRYAEVVDVLTAYGRIAFQCGAFDMAVDMLAPLYEIAVETRQAYYLAKSHHARSLQADSVSTALDECERAIPLAQHALQSDIHHRYAEVSLMQLEEDRTRLREAQQ